MDPRITLLSVSPCPNDHDTLADILPVQILCASTFPDAMKLLGRRAIGLVVCERDLPPHSWRDVLAAVTALRKRPLVIVTSLHADDHLWAEALNLGAHDVLAKPFDTAEVTRAVSTAALHWRWHAKSDLPLTVRAAS